MKLQILAGAAVLALIATADATAATKKAGAYAEPSQPVAYSKLDAYLKASPTKRAKQDWSLGSAATASAAPTGAAANTSATAPQTPAPAAEPAPQAGMMPNNSAPAATPGHKRRSAGGRAAGRSARAELGPDGPVGCAGRASGAGEPGLDAVGSGRPDAEHAGDVTRSGSAKLARARDFLAGAGRPCG